MDIHRIELPTRFGMTTVNSYLIAGDRISLVDVGESTPECIQALEDGINKLGVDLRDVEDIIITHPHVDHIGGAGYFSEACDATVHVSEMVYPWLTRLSQCWDHRFELIKETMSAYVPEHMAEHFIEFYGGIKDQMLGASQNVNPDRIRIYDTHDKSIDIGGELWQTIYAPGHSTSQTCFYHTQTRSLLSADMLLKLTPTVLIEPKSPTSTERQVLIFQFLNSYARMRELEIEVVYPGHYETFSDHVRLIDRQVNRIHERTAQVLRHIQKGADD
ncbi:MAG: MBL fold metallo-hydrolase, partial [Bacteroidota bacterium]